MIFFPKIYKKRQYFLNDSTAHLAEKATTNYFLQMQLQKSWKCALTYWLVFSASVSQDPPRLYWSMPPNSWLKNRGWPEINHLVEYCNIVSEAKKMLHKCRFYLLASDIYVHSLVVNLYYCHKNIFRIFQIC